MFSIFSNKHSCITSYRSAKDMQSSFKASIFYFWQAIISEILLFVFLMKSVPAEVPPGYIMKLIPYCGRDGRAPAEIKLITDVDATARGKCLNGEYQFFTKNTISHSLTVDYPEAANGSRCMFHKRAGVLVYRLKVVVSWREPDNPGHYSEEEFRVTCTFDARGSDDSIYQDVVDGLIAPTEVQAHRGVQTNSSVVLRMTDVLGHWLVGQSVPLGKKVSLVAYSKGSKSEQGLRAVSCNAVAVSSGQRYAILRAGCGDGVVFDRRDGFITDGLHAESPYFELFNLHAMENLKFECNFTLCSSNCDGSSCQTQRRRREVEEDAKVQYNVVESPMITLKNWLPEAIGHVVHKRSNIKGALKTWVITLIVMDIVVLAVSLPFLAFYLKITINGNRF